MKNVCPSYGGWPTLPTKHLYASWPALWRCTLCFELVFCFSATSVNWFGWSLILPAPCSIPLRWCWGWMCCLCAVSEVMCLECGHQGGEPWCPLMFSRACFSQASSALPSSGEKSKVCKLCWWYWSFFPIWESCPKCSCWCGHRGWISCRAGDTKLIIH